MSDHITEGFARTDLRQIRAFILHGAEDVDVQDMPYNKRLIHGTNTIVKRLEGIYQDQEQMDKAHNDLALALGTYQEVYMEIGMKVGARLIYQLLVVDDELPIRNEQ